MFNPNCSINIQMLLQCSNPGIVAFVNDIDHKVWITSTNSTLSCITTNIELLKQQFHKIKELNKDIQNLKVKVLEQHGSSRYLKYKVKSWYYFYTQQGYTVYDKGYKAFEYRFHEVIGTTKDEEHPILLYIGGKSRALQTMILVGKFKNKVELEAFKDRGVEVCLKEIDS